MEAKSVDFDERRRSGRSWSGVAAEVSKVGDIGGDVDIDIIDCTESLRGIDVYDETVDIEDDDTKEGKELIVEDFEIWMFALRFNCDDECFNWDICFCRCASADCLNERFIGSKKYCKE